MHVIARVRHTVARHPLLYWATVAGVAVVLAALVAAGMHEIDARRRSWGTTRQVWIVTSDLHAGDRIVAEPRDMPMAMLPAAAADVDPTGRMARQTVTAGEVVTWSDVTGDGVAALLPSGSIALTIASSVGATLRVGDAVVVYESGRTLATGTVVSGGDDAVMVAVDASVAPAVSQAALDGTAVVGLAGGGPSG